MPIVSTGTDKRYHVLRMQAVYMAKLGLKNNRVSLWTVAGIITAAALIAVVAGYAVHKLRMRHVMQNEIRDIMCAIAPYHALFLDHGSSGCCVGCWLHTGGQTSDQPSAAGNMQFTDSLTLIKPRLIARKMKFQSVHCVAAPMRLCSSARLAACAHILAALGDLAYSWIRSLDDVSIQAVSFTSAGHHLTGALGK